MGVSPSNPVGIPLVPSVPFYRIGVTLNDTRYLMDVRWNVRDSAWYMDLYESDETPIAYGLKLVIGVYIGRRVKHSLFQNGAFLVKSLDGSGLDMGFDDVGTRAELRYYTSYDLIAAS